MRTSESEIEIKIKKVYGCHSEICTGLSAITAISLFMYFYGQDEYTTTVKVGIGIFGFFSYLYICMSIM